MDPAGMTELRDYLVVARLSGSAEGMGLNVTESPPAEGARKDVAVTRHGRRDFGHLIYLALAVEGGIQLRLSVPKGARFPLGDGGLFLQMTRELGRAGWLPTTTLYNAEHLPFAYPPLGFLLALLVRGLTGSSLLGVFQWMGVVESILAIPAFAFLARGVLGEGMAWVFATAIFALLPDAFYGEVMGAGVTRGLGQMLALAALGTIVRAYRRGGPAWIVAAGVLSGLTVLSHPDWALFTASSAVVLLVGCADRSRQVLARAVAIAALALLVSSPWWVTVIAHNGVATLLAPIGSGAQQTPFVTGLATLLTLQLSQETLFPLGVAAGVVGLVLALARGWYLLPAWLLIVLVAEPRASASRAVVVLALLGGIAFTTLPAIGRGVSRDDRPDGEHIPGAAVGRRPPRWLGWTLLAWALLYLFANATLYNTRSAGSLAPGDVAAMRWVARHTPAGATFYVLYDPRAGYNPRGGYIHPGEWFPALTGRRNVDAPAVGYEWVPGAIVRQERANREAMRCARRTVACVERWARKAGITFDYLYVAAQPWRPGSRLPRPTCCPSVLASLDPARYQRVYAAGGAAVYRIR